MNRTTALLGASTLTVQGDQNEENNFAEVPSEVAANIGIAPNIVSCPSLLCVAGLFDGIGRQVKCIYDRTAEALSSLINLQYIPCADSLARVGSTVTSVQLRGTSIKDFKQLQRGLTVEKDFSEISGNRGLMEEVYTASFLSMIPHNDLFHLLEDSAKSPLWKWQPSCNLNNHLLQNRTVLAEVLPSGVQFALQSPGYLVISSTSGVFAYLAENSDDRKLMIIFAGTGKAPPVYTVSEYSGKVFEKQFHSNQCRANIDNALWGITPVCYQESLALARLIKRTLKEITYYQDFRLCCTGHSKGGAIAAKVAALLNTANDDPVQAICLSAAQLGSEQIMEIQAHFDHCPELDKTAVLKHIKHFSPPKDIFTGLSSALTHVGEFYELPESDRFRNLYGESLSVSLSQTYGDSWKTNNMVTRNMHPGDFGLVRHGDSHRYLHCVLKDKLDRDFVSKFPAGVLTKCGTETPKAEAVNPTESAFRANGLGSVSDG